MRPARNLIFLTDTHRNILKTFVQLFFSDLQYFFKYDAFKFSPDEDYCHARWSLPNLQQITQWGPLAFAWRTLLYDEVYFPYNRASITMTANALSLYERSLRLRLRYRFAFHIALLRKKILNKICTFWKFCIQLNIFFNISKIILNFAKKKIAIS